MEITTDKIENFNHCTHYRDCRRFNLGKTLGYFTNQELGDIAELPEIKSQYEKLENYKIELEKINQNNQKNSCRFRKPNN